MSAGDPIGGTATAESVLPALPYPGLRSFKREEWPIFFGREVATDELVRRVLERQFVVVHGASGCGKSSLVKAGVLAQLQQSSLPGGPSWRTDTMQPGDAPLGNLSRALARLVGRDDPSFVTEIRRRLNERSPAAALGEHLRQASSQHLCLVVDQFEEVFRFAREVNRDEAISFVEVLVACAADPPPGLFLLVTMRSEFLGECARFPGLAEAFNDTQYLLPRMSRSNLLRAIREPAWLYGGDVATDLAERLVHDAGASEDELPLVQHALMLLWSDAVSARASGDRLGDAVPPGDPTDRLQPGGGLDGPRGPTLSLADYTARGGLSKLLSEHADATLMATAGGDPVRLRVVETLFRALTDINADNAAIRRPQRLADLVAVADAPEDVVREVIDAFRTDGVSFVAPFAPSPIDGETVIDISHEALIRGWRRIADPADGWLHSEFRDGLNWRSLVVQADSFHLNPQNVLSPAVTEDRKEWMAGRNAQWSERYGGRWDRVQRLLDASRLSSEAERAREHDEQRRAAERELRVQQAVQLARTRRRWMFGVGAVALVALGIGWSGDVAARTATVSLYTTGSELMRQEGEHGSAARFALAALDVRRTGIADAIVARAVHALAAALHTGDLDTIGRHQDWVRSVAVLPDGRIVSGSDDRQVLVWDLQSPEQPLELGEHDGYVRSVAVLPDGRVVSGGDDGRVMLWHLDRPGEGMELGRHEGQVEAVAVLPGGRVASGGDDNRVRLWSPDAPGVPLLTIEHEESVSALVALDAERLLSAGFSGVIRMWPLADPGEGIVLGNHGGPISGLALLSGQRIASVGRGGLRIWAPSRPGELAAEHESEGWWFTVAELPDGRLVVGGDDNRVMVSGPSSLQFTEIGRHGDWVRSVALLPDDTIVSGSDDGTVRVWGSERTASAFGELGRHGDWARVVVMLPDGRVASGGDDGSIFIWDLEGRIPPVNLVTSHRRVLALAVLDDGRLASAGDEGPISIWSLDSPSQPVDLGSHDGIVTALAVLDDGRVVSGGSDNWVRVWSTAVPGTPVAEVALHAEVSALAIVDRTHVVAGLGDGTTYAWRPGEDAIRMGRTPADRERGEDGAGDARVHALAPFGTTSVVSGNQAGRLVIWDMTQPDRSPRELGRVDASIFSLAVLDNGWIAIGADNKLQLWRIDGSAPVDMGTHDDWIRSLAVAPGDEYLVSAGDDRRVRSWNPKLFWDAEVAIRAARSTLRVTNLTPRDRERGRTLGLP